MNYRCPECGFSPVEKTGNCPKCNEPVTVENPKPPMEDSPSDRIVVWSCFGMLGILILMAIAIFVSM